MKDYKRLRRKQAYKPRKGGFAKAVMKVVNKRAESKQYTTSAEGNYLGSTDFQTWNITHNLPQGTTTSSRIGDKIFIKQIRLSLALRNWNSLGTRNSDGFLFRVIVFRGKYDYATFNYPASEVFELNAGASASPNYALARLDTNQITPLFDKVISFPQSNFQNQSNVKHMLKLIKVNKSFMYKDDDTFAKTSNLYVGFVPYIYGAEGTCGHTHNISFTYTDV